jgi:hypothetical protein
VENDIARAEAPVYTRILDRSISTSQYVSRNSEGHMENVQPIISLLFILICNNSNFNTKSVFPDIALHISNYYINILHARLRQKCSSLTLDLFRCNLIASYNYDCGNYTESVDHLFLACA